MHPFPEDLDAIFLVGKVLEFIGFSENTVSLSFSEKSSITVFSSFEHIQQDIEPITYTVPVQASSVMQLLGRQVVSANLERDGALSVVFDHGGEIRILNDVPNFEAYCISYGDQDIYV